MATKKKGAARKGKASTKKKTTKKRAPPTKAKAQTSTRASKPPMVMKRNDRAAQERQTRSVRTPPEEVRTPLAERVQNMGATHVAACIGTGAAGNVLAMTSVVKGWAGPKASALALFGAGTAATAAGYYWEMDHMMAGGAGAMAAGAFSMANVLAYEAYGRMEEREKEEDAEEAKEEEEKELAKARKLIADAEKKRNGRVFVAVDDDGKPLDYASADEQAA